MQHDLVFSRWNVTLRPLRLTDAATLFPLLDDQMWAGMSSPTPRTVDEYAAYLHSILSTDGTYAFAVTDEEGNALGVTSFYDYTPLQRRVEIGHTWYRREVWGTHVNPAAKFQLMQYAFETWKLRRVALRCDAANDRSAHAIERLGASYEGTLRNHRVAPNGEQHDTKYFSVIDEEWPVVRDGLLTRLTSAA